MTDTTASSTLPRPAGDLPDDDLLLRWQHSAGVTTSPELHEARGAEPSDHEPDHEPDDEPDAAVPEPRRRTRRALSVLRPARVIVAAVVVAALVLAGYAFRQDRSTTSALSERSAATQAARSDAVALATYKYTDLTGFFDSVKAFSTPGFASTFDKGAQSLVKVLTDYKATSSGKLASFGLTSFTKARAVVLVIIDQTVANSASKTPSDQTEAFTYTMVHQGGRWLLDAATSVH